MSDFDEMLRKKYLERYGGVFRQAGMVISGNAPDNALFALSEALETVLEMEMPRELREVFAWMEHFVDAIVEVRGTWVRTNNKQRPGIFTSANNLRSAAGALITFPEETLASMASAIRDPESTLGAGLEAAQTAMMANITLAALGIDDPMLLLEDWAERRARKNAERS